MGLNQSVENLGQRGTMCNDSPIAGLYDLKISSDMMLSHFFGDPEMAIGKGGFGQVAKTTRNYAVKYAKKNFNTLKEIAILNYLDHPNLLCIDAYFGKDDFYAYYLPLAKGTLKDYTTMLKTDPILRREAYYQIFNGLAYLHSVYIIHADLKPSNILVFEEEGEYIYRIADFGLSIPCSYADIEHYSFKMTRQWRPPELLTQNIKNKNKYIKITEKIDIWAMGVIMFDMIYQIDDRYHLFVHIKDYDEKHILENIKQNLRTRTDVNTLFAPSEKYLANKCLQINESERPSAFDCLNDDFFKAIRKQDDLDLILKHTKSTPNDYVVETYDDRELLCDIVSDYTYDMNDFSTPEETIHMMIFYAMFLLDGYFSLVALPFKTFKKFKLKTTTFEKESRILQDYQESLRLPNNEKYVRLRLKTNRTAAEQKDFTNIEQILRGNMEDLFFIETFDRLNNYKYSFMGYEKFEALKDLYGDIDTITDFDTYVDKINDIMDTLSNYERIDRLIFGAIKLAILFISEETLGKSFLTFDEYGVEDLLKTINYEIYIPTAIQYFVKKNGKLPTHKQFPKLYEKLRKSPYQKKIVDEFIAH